MTDDTPTGSRFTLAVPAFAGAPERDSPPARGAAAPVTGAMPGLEKTHPAGEPCMAADVPGVPADVPRVTADAPRVAADVPGVTADAPRVAADVPRVVAAIPGPHPKASASGSEALAFRLAAWLERACAGESAPAGLAAELLAEVDGRSPADLAESDRRCDLYALWEAMTRVAQEVKLQGRAFQRLQDSIEPLGALAPRVDSALAAHAEALDRVQDAAAEGEALREERADADSAEADRRAEAQWLEPMLDVRERLERSVRDARARLAASPEEPAHGAASPPAAIAPPAGRLARWFGCLAPRAAPAAAGEAGTAPDRSAVEALIEGNALVLARLEDALAERGVQAIARAGDRFDPRRMRAVEAVEDAGVAEGTVLDVLRQGYERESEVFRPAEVRVARAPRTGASRDPQGSVR